MTKCPSVLTTGGFTSLSVKARNWLRVKSTRDTKEGISRKQVFADEIAQRENNYDCPSCIQVKIFSLKW